MSVFLFSMASRPLAVARVLSHTRVINPKNHLFLCRVNNRPWRKRYGAASLVCRVRGETKRAGIVVRRNGRRLCDVGRRYPLMPPSGRSRDRANLDRVLAAPALFDVEGAEAGRQRLMAVRDRLAGVARRDAGRIDDCRPALR
ncbi:hypothetical protein [Salinisphaera sp. Q1T1-3]|uniref:hypothetical protein n=1 Tax=Salinisphaera sp. Q1T1-3 TaxID=2321229 RepID=UPI0011C49338|nr:hypothetical protein [Salinisphaera sp. Q1T1-3]